MTRHFSIKKCVHTIVTCAVGLTCPARLNSVERITYARDKNAIMGTSTTARSIIRSINKILVR